jgi:signal peptidase
MKGGTKVINIVLSVILWVVVIIAAFFSVVTLTTKSAAGIAYFGDYAPMTVLTDSMKGEFNQGDLIIVERVEDVGTLQVDDIIAFWTLIENKKSLNTHRIIEIRNEEGASMPQFVTKGDANPIEDIILVSGGDVVGQYRWKVPAAGRVMGVLSSSTGFLVIIVLPLLVFFIWQLYKLIVLIIQLKKEAVMEATEASRQSIEDEVRKKILEEEVKKRLEAELDAQKATGPPPAAAPGAAPTAPIAPQPAATPVAPAAPQAAAAPAAPGTAPTAPIAPAAAPQPAPVPAPIPAAAPQPAVAPQPAPAAPAPQPAAAPATPPPPKPPQP